MVRVLHFFYTFLLAILISIPSTLSTGIKGGYWLSWNADSNPPSSIPESYYTHIFYSFVQLDSTTYQLAVSETDDQTMPVFTSTLHSKQPPMKAFFSIGGGGGDTISKKFSSMASNPSNRQNFIKSTIEVARKYSFDGLDLDWEHPADQQEMTNLGLLFAEWRAAADMEARQTNKPRLLISAAVYLSANLVLLDSVERNYPVQSIRDNVDFLNVMSYDYRGSWDTSVTGAHALLYDSGSKYSTSEGIQSWINAGVPAQQLVMGLPMYGHTWKLKDPNVNGIGAAAVGVGPGDKNGVMFYYQVMDFNEANGATVMYDDKTVSTYSYAGDSWIGYDDTRSIKKKVEYANTNGLGGYFFWAFGYDKDSDLAMEAIHSTSAISSTVGWYVVM